MTNKGRTLALAAFIFSSTSSSCLKVLFSFVFFSGKKWEVRKEERESRGTTPKKENEQQT